MKFGGDDRADASTVEDRRGRGGFPGGGYGVGGGLGVVGVIVVVVFKLLSGDTQGAVDVALDNADPRTAPQPTVASPVTSAAISGSCEGVNSESDPAKFIVCVETNVQAFWTKELPRAGTAYHTAKLVLFTDRTSSACGPASAATGPFYCPPDEKVYLDIGFFKELQARFHARGGDFAEAYVVAHEYGHHVQALLGTEEKAHEGMRDPRKKSALSVALELQADCYAGVWGHFAYTKGKVSQNEIADALDAAAAVGDDRIQKEVRGRVNPETFTHGSAASRQKWFGVGMNGGDPSKCDTFNEGP
jgi:predicted metalloprotease